MATTGTGPGSSGMGTTDWNTTAGQQGGGEQPRDRRAVGDTSTATDPTGIAQTLRDSTYRSLDDQKSRASETLGSLAGAVRGMTQPLREGGQGQIADYVNKAADGIERWASDLRQQDLEDAVRAVEQFARRQPVMFLGLAFGAGLIAARFLKSSNPQGNLRPYRQFDTTPSGSAIGAPRLGSTGLGSTGLGSSSFSSTTGDISRPTADIRPSGEVL